MAEFGKMTGYTATHIGRLEKGISVPKDEFIDCLCEVFRVKKEYFVGDLNLEEVLITSEQKECSNEVTVSERIKKLREERGLSMSMLGEIAGLDQSFISRVESGESKIGFASAEKIAGALNVTACEK